MSIDIVMPTSELSSVEEDIIVQVFTNPVVKKYLTQIGQNDIKELLTLSAISMDKEKLAIAHATVQGKLAVVTTLLGIEAPKS